MGGGRRNLDCDWPPSSHPEERGGPPKGKRHGESTWGPARGCWGEGRGLCVFLTPVLGLESKLQVPAGSAPPEGPEGDCSGVSPWLVNVSSSPPARVLPERAASRRPLGTRASVITGLGPSH